MDGPVPESQPQQPIPEAEVRVTFDEFLQSVPPDTPMLVSEVLDWQMSPGGDYGGRPHPYASLNAPVLRLHCEHGDCGGVRNFTAVRGDFGGFISDEADYQFLKYRCENCKESPKTFALLIERGQPYSAATRIIKLGEFPTFGPPIPARVMTLVGPDRELFLKGRRAELRGLGIGAFAYYRRVVDQQKDRIIEEMRKVAARLEVHPPVLKLFDEAKTESQFSTTVEKIKDAIPESLKVKNQNPLTLLYDAVSEGLHRGTDEECLERATFIRLVLTELAERISNALKDDQELTEAMKRLQKRKS